MHYISISQIKNIQRTCEIFEQALLSTVKIHHLMVYAHDMAKVKKGLDNIIANLKMSQSVKQTNSKHELRKVIKNDIKLVVSYYEHAYKNLQHTSLETPIKVAISSHCVFQIQSLKSL